VKGEAPRSGLSKGLIERLSLQLNDRYLNAGYDGSVVAHFADLVHKAWMAFFATLGTGAAIALLSRTLLGIVIGVVVMPLGLVAFSYPFFEIKSLEQAKAAGIKNERLFIGFVFLVFVDGKESVIDAFKYLKTSRLFSWIKRDSTFIEASVKFDGKTPVEALMARSNAAADEETKAFFAGMAHAAGEDKTSEFFNGEVAKFKEVLLDSVARFNKSITSTIKYTFVLAFVPIILLMLGMFAPAMTYVGALAGVVTAPVYLVVVYYIITKARPRVLRVPRQASISPVDGLGIVFGVLSFLATDQAMPSAFIAGLSIAIIYTIRTRGKKNRNRLAESALPGLIDAVSDAKTANKTILQGLTEYSAANPSSPLGAHVKKVVDRYYTTGAIESKTGVWLVDYVIDALGLMSSHDSGALLMQKFKDVITDTYKSRVVKGYSYATATMYMMPFAIGVLTALGLGLPGLFGTVGSVLGFSLKVTPLLSAIAYANVFIISLSVAVAMQYVKGSLDNPLPIVVVLAVTVVVAAVLMPVITGLVSGLLPTFTQIPGGYYPGSPP
jgi:hypothetical protein